MTKQGQENAPETESSLAAEIGNRGGIQGLPQRLERYSVAHARSLKMRDYLQDAHGLEREYQRLSTCGEYLLFRWFYSLDAVRLAALHSCKMHLLCPLCAIRRGSKLLTSYMGKFGQLLTDYPNLTPVFFTLTIKDGPDLKERHKHLVKSWKTYRSRARDALRGKCAFNQVNKFAGAVWSIETKIGENSGVWHPHLHGIAMCTDIPVVERMREEWKDITGDSFVLHARPIYDDPVEAFLEIFKYAVKLSDLELRENLEAYETLRGKRLVDSFGVFRGVEVPEALEDDLSDLEGLPYSEMLFRYLGASGYVLDHRNHCRQAA